MAGSAATPDTGNGPVADAAKLFEDVMDLDDAEAQDEEGEDTLGDEEENPDELQDEESDEGLEDEEGDEDEDTLDADEDEEASRKGEAKPDSLTTVKENGKDKKVTVKEAAAGYMRTQDYTVKTQAVAEEKKATAAEKAVYSTLVTQLREHLDKVVKENEPDWAALRESDPAEYAAKKVEWQELQGKRDAAKAEEDRLAGERNAEDLEAVEKYVAEEKERLLEKLPSWKDEAVAKREIAAIRKYMADNGFTPEEIRELRDHRAVAIIRKAALYDRQKTTVRSKLRPAKPGKSLEPGGHNRTSSNPARRGVRDAEARLVKTGRVEDAAALLMRSGLLDSKKR